MAYDEHPEDAALGGDFLHLRFNARTGEERNAHRAEIERQRQERKDAVQKRQKQRDEAEAAAARRKRIKRRAWEQHGRVLTDAEADKVAAEGLDDGPPDSRTAETGEAALLKAADKANANRHAPPRLQN